MTSAVEIGVPVYNDIYIALIFSDIMISWQCSIC